MQFSTLVLLIKLISDGNTANCNSKVKIVIYSSIVFTIALLTLHIVFGIHYILSVQSFELVSEMESGNLKFLEEITIKDPVTLFLILSHLGIAFLHLSKLSSSSLDSNEAKLNTNGEVLDNENEEEEEDLLENTLKLSGGDSRFILETSRESPPFISTRKKLLRFLSITRMVYILSLMSLIALNNGLVICFYAFILAALFIKNLFKLNSKSEFTFIKIIVFVEKPYTALLLLAHLTFRTKLGMNSMTEEMKALFMGSSFDISSYFGYYHMISLLFTFVVSCLLSSNIKALEELSPSLSDSFLTIEYSQMNTFEKFLNSIPAYFNVGSYRAFQMILVVWGLTQPTLIMFTLFLGGGVGLLVNEGKGKGKLIYMVFFQILAGLYVVGQLLINQEGLFEDLSTNSSVYLLGFYKYHKVSMNSFSPDSPNEVMAVISNRILYFGKDIFVLTILSFLSFITESGEKVEEKIIEELESIESEEEKVNSPIELPMPIEIISPPMTSEPILEEQINIEKSPLIEQKQVEESKLDNEEEVKEGIEETNRLAKQIEKDAIQDLQESQENSQDNPQENQQESLPQPNNENIELQPQPNIYLETKNEPIEPQNQKETVVKFKIEGEFEEEKFDYQFRPPNPLSTPEDSFDPNALDFSYLKSRPSTKSIKSSLSAFLRDLGNAFVIHTAKITLVLLFIASLFRYDGLHAGYFFLFLVFSLISLLSMQKYWRLLLSYTLAIFVAQYIFQLLNKFDVFPESYILDQIGLTRVNGVFLYETREHLTLLLILFLQSTIFTTEKYKDYLTTINNRTIEDIDIVSSSSLDDNDSNLKDKSGKSKSRIDIVTVFYMRYGLGLCYFILLMESFLYPLNATSFLFFLFFAIFVILFLVYNDERKSFLKLKNLWPWLIVFSYLVLTARYFYQLEFINTAIIGSYEDWPLKEIGFEANIPTIKLLSAAAILGCVNAQLKIFRDPLTTYYLRRIREKEESNMLRLRESTLPFFYYCSGIYIRQFISVHISHVLLLYVFTTSIIFKSGIGLLFFSILMIILLVEKENRWRTAWIPLSFYALSIIAMQYVILLKNPENFLKAVIQWSGFATELGSTLTFNILTHLILILLCVIQRRSEFWKSKFILSKIALENKEREYAGFEKKAEEMKETRNDIYLLTLQQQLLHRPIISGSTIIHSYNELFANYGYEIGVVMIVIMAFLTINALSVVYIVFASYLVYRSAEKVYSEDSRIRKVWMATYILIILEMTRKYALLLWFPASWNIPYPWKDSEFMCAEAGKRLFSTRPAFHDESDLVHCINEWKFWLSIEKYPHFYFIFEYITVIGLLLHEKFLSIPDFKDSNSIDPVTGDANDFTYHVNRSSYIQTARYYLYNYSYRVPLVILFVIGALDTLTGVGNLISAVYLLISMTLLYKSIWYFKNFEIITEKIELMHSGVLAAFFIFQAPLFPCPLYTEDTRTFFPNDECLTLQYESKRFFFAKTGGDGEQFNYFKVSYVIFVQTLGLNKISSSSFHFNSQLLFMILFLFLILIQKKLFRSPFMKAYIIPYHERELKNQKDKALKYVQSVHLNRIRSHKLTNVKREASAWLQARVDKKVKDWENILGKDVEETGLLLPKGGNDILSKFDENLVKKAEQMALNPGRAVLTVQEYLDLFTLAESAEEFKALHQHQKNEREISELEIITSIQVIGIYSYTSFPRFTSALDDRMIQILNEINAKAKQEESWRVSHSSHSISKDSSENMLKDILPKAEMEARRKSMIATKARIEECKKDHLKDFFEEGGSVRNQDSLDLMKDLRDEEILDDDELRLKEKEEEQVQLQNLQTEKKKEKQAQKDHLIKKMENHYNKHTFLLELKEKKKEVVNDVSMTIKTYFISRIHEVYYYNSDDFSFTGEENFILLFGYLVLSQIDKLTMVFFIANHVFNGNLLSLIFPLSLFFYAVLENPIPQRIYWKTMIFYTIFIITLKFLYQFPLFCGTPPYSLIDRDVMSCQTLNINPTDLINRIDYLIGIRKFSGNSSYPKNEGFFNGVLLDYLTLLMLLIHRHVLKVMGFWKYIKISNSLFYSPQFCDADLDSLPTDRRGMLKSLQEFFLRLLPIYLPPTHEVNNMITKRVEKVETNPTKIKPGKDLYVPQATFSLLVMMYYMIYFTKMNGKRETIADTLDRRSHFSSELVYALIFLIAWIITDRVIYKLKDDIMDQTDPSNKEKVKHAMLLKLILHIFLVIFVHIYICFKLPLANHTFFADSPYLIGVYILYCLYFYYSALQIKHGYPELESQQIFMENTSSINTNSFKIFRSIPFILELKNALDWSVSKTSLDFSSWVRLDEVYANLYLVRGEMNSRKGYPSGVKRRYLEKLFQGYAFILIIIIIIIAPIVMFSSLNPILQHNNVQAGSITMELNYEMNKEGAGRQRFRLKLFEVSNLMISPMTEDEFTHIRTMYSDIENDWLPRMQVAKIAGYSDTVWNPSPPMIRSLASILDSEDTELMLEASWEFHRAQPPGSEVTKGFNRTPLNKKVKNVLKQILEDGSKSPIQSFEAPRSFFILFRIISSFHFIGEDTRGKEERVSTNFIKCLCT